MRAGLISLLLLVLVGCVSTHMKQYIGKDIREVILDSGPPMSAMDMGNGIRAFQFRWGGGTYRMPSATTTHGMVTTYGNSAWLSANSITTGGDTIHSEGCIISYLAAWNGDQEAWIVKDVRYPDKLVC